MIIHVRYHSEDYTVNGISIKKDSTRDFVSSPSQRSNILGAAQDMLDAMMLDLDAKKGTIR